GVHEILWSADRTVDVAFRREVDERDRPIRFEHAVDQTLIADISVHELIARVIPDQMQAAGIARVGELVQIDDPRRFVGQPLQDKICADETCTPCNENPVLALHECISASLAHISVQANAPRRVMPELKFAPMKPAPPVTRIQFAPFTKASPSALSTSS